MLGNDCGLVVVIWDNCEKGGEESERELLDGHNFYRGWPLVPPSTCGGKIGR
jgi:hypothetical protein